MENLWFVLILEERKNYKMLEHLPLIPIFSFPSFAFFNFTLLFLSIVCAAIHEELWKATTWTLILFLGLNLLFGDLVYLVRWGIGNPYTIGLIALTYIILGVIWGVFKWFLLCRNRLEEYQGFMDRWLSSKGYGRDDLKVKNIKDEWNKYLGNSYNIKSKPKASDHKAQIISWMAYWPLSILAWIFHDFISSIFRYIYLTLKGSMDLISNWVWKDVDL